MAIPTTPTWNIVDFSETALGTMLGLPPSDQTAAPSVSPYFSYNADSTILYAKSASGVEGSLRFGVSLPSRFTLNVVLRCPQLPHNLGDLSVRRVGFTVADDSGRGFTLYLAKTGVAISRIDNYGAATALPDTADVTQAVATTFFTVRVAADGAMGRAYVFVGPGNTDTPALRWIIPIEPTPATFGDAFRFFVKGLSTEPVSIEVMALQLAGDLVIANYPPVADAGPDRVATVGSAVRFDGRASYDVEGVPIRYKWSCIDAPYGSAFTAEASSAVTPDDGSGLASSIYLPPIQIPEWLSSRDLVRFRGEVYGIAGIVFAEGRIQLTVSNAPGGIVHEPLRFIRQSILLDAQSPTPTAVPDLPGIYRFQLVVNDGESDSEPSEVLASITALPTPAGIEPDVSLLWKAIGDEWRLIPGRDVFEESWVAVAQILSGKLLEVWQRHYNTSIRDAQQVFQRKWIAYRTFTVETSPNAAVISPRYGDFLATHRFELGFPPGGTFELIVDVLNENGTYTSAATTVYMEDEPLLSDVVSSVNAALSTAGIVEVKAEVRGSREALPNLWHQGIAVTSDVPGGLSDILETDGNLGWFALGDIISFVGQRRTIVAILGDYTLRLSEPIPVTLTIYPYWAFKAARFALVGSRPFSLSGSACDAWGLPSGVLNTSLAGEGGTRVTDRVYHVGRGDLSALGVVRGDLLVLNNGESFRIDRVISDPADPWPNQRVLLFDMLPPDAGATWVIPSVIRGGGVDYEMEGVYPGDLAKIEIYTPGSGQVKTANGYVIAQKGSQLAVRLDLAAHEAVVGGKELRFVGVKRRKAIPLPEDVLSVPSLQELIAAKLKPQRLQEHIDYVLEPFYRDVGGRSIPMLQFADHVFIDPDLEPADVLWAETTLFDNQGHVEDLFGRLVNFLRDDASSFPKDFNYVAGVAGLLYAQQRGPSVFAMSVGAQILLGQPFAEAAGYIEEIRANYSPRQGRLLIRDADGNVPTESDTVRAYYYTKLPSDLSETSGLAINPETGGTWTTGEYVQQFSLLGAGVDIVDIYKDPRWWRAFVGSGVMYEVEKFHRFVCTFDLDVVDLANVSLLFSLLTRIKPTYTRALIVGTHSIFDDLDLADVLEKTITLNPYDTLIGRYGIRYDDYGGDGLTSCLYDDGVTRFDALVDSILDTIAFEATIQWPGGTLSFPTVWPFHLGTQVVDIDGAETGTPGNAFTLTNGMNLAAGHYRTILKIKDSPVLPPL